MDCQAKLTASKRECDSMFEATRRIFSSSKNATKADQSGEALQYLVPALVLAKADSTTGQAGYEAEYYRVKLLAHRLRKARATGQHDFDSFATERSLANYSNLRRAVRRVMQDNTSKKATAHPVPAGNTILQQLKATVAAKAAVSRETSPTSREQKAAPGLSCFARTEAEGNR